jgi:hypothetical protein
MRALLGKGRIVDDPSLDRPMALDLRQHHLLHFAEDLLVRPAPFADKMQKRLVLRCRSLRRRHRRHRLHALAFARHHQAQAIVAQRSRSIRVPNDAHKPLDIGRKATFNALSSKIHPSPHVLKNESSQAS